MSGSTLKASGQKKIHFFGDASRKTIPSVSFLCTCVITDTMSPKLYIYICFSNVKYWSPS